MKEANSISQEDVEKLLQATKKAYDDAKKKIGGKGIRPYAQKIREKVESATGFYYVQKTKSKNEEDKGNDAGCKLFSVMLDHAARRIISRLSWIKNAEAKRTEFEENLKKLDEVPSEVKQLLDDYCADRKDFSNADDEYRIRRAALSGWEEVLKSWKKCTSKEERIDSAKKLQDQIEKFALLVNVKDHQFLPKEELDAIKSGDKINVWRDISCDPLTKGKWLYTKNYWNNVEQRVCDKLQKYNEEILDKLESPF
ncbi:MAG: hypothetical protein LBQ50_14035 [Planctomycetaceae bacterium]|nr:hypothetical protein [Planctomycetaceae bacterium]